MPPVVAVSATFVAALAGSASALTFVTFVVMAASIAYSAYALANMPDMPGYSSEVRGRTQVVRSAIQPHRVIYGKCMVSGPLVYILTTKHNDPSDAEKIALGYTKDSFNAWVAPR